ncbi:sensor histidine kinase [Nocardioides ferulae]|uniref:sensor histidine kinase n=1 Tax=Nocardioides ferulae TaxID=2340821 RepID=UPI0013DE6385|nr:HAMP domain-containing sensor histidine kinase [Nocardioides ferulae]
MTGTTTTERALHDDARPIRSGVSVRTRITAAVALVVAVTLALAGLVVYAIEAQRIEEAVTRAVDQELAEFRVLSDPAGPDGVADTRDDPDPASLPGSVPGALRLFLSRNVPDDDELLVAWWDGAAKLRSPSDPLAASPEFAAAVAPLVGENGSTTLTGPDGEVLITVQSADDGTTQGALVVATYLDATRGELRDTMRTYAIVAALSLLLVAAVASWLSGRLLAPLRVLRETTDELTDADLTRRIPVRGNDDITALTRTVNRMLDRMEASFLGQRQFLDDAGHELKTPLTVLRGHLELLDTGSPAEVAETKALLLDEVDRMSRLVGDLILLAKSDRPDFVTPAPVDVGELTKGVLAKARGLGDRDWRLDGTAEIVAKMDEQRITQALLQLADNAVKHTDPGSVVAVGSASDAGSVRLWVRDTGAGVPPADRDHVFERFGRSQVRPTDEGFGLGLSIVRAIAVAHGGSVTIEDAEPHGARFVLTLPAPDRRPPPHEEESWPAS